MTKTEFEQQKLEIEKRLGKPEWDFGKEPLNDSAKELKQLFKVYKSHQMTESHKKRREDEAAKESLLTEKQQRLLEKRYQLYPSIPIDLSEADLAYFTADERPVITQYFRNIDQTPSELNRHFPQWTTQRITALMRSGPFQVLATKVFDHLMAMKVKSAALKGVDALDKQLIVRFAEQYGVLKNQELTLNVNKTLDDPKLLKKLKDLGDSEA